VETARKDLGGIDQTRTRAVEVGVAVGGVRASTFDGGYRLPAVPSCDFVEVFDGLGEFKPTRCGNESLRFCSEHLAPVSYRRGVPRGRERVGTACCLYEFGHPVTRDHRGFEPVEHDGACVVERCCPLTHLVEARTQVRDDLLGGVGTTDRIPDRFDVVEDTADGVGV
jgi:hypothetical protein